MKKYITRLCIFLNLILILNVLYACSLNNAQTTETTSETIVTQETTETTTLKNAAIPIDIVLHTENLKTEYLRGEEIDLSGLEIELLYSDETKESIPLENCSVNEIDTSTCSSKELIVFYEPFSKSINLDVTYSVTVIEPCTKYASISLNLRSGPGTEFEILTSIPLNTAVTVIGITDNGWVKIIYQNQEYFCSNKYLITEPKMVPTPKPAGPYDNYVAGEHGTKADVLARANYWWNDVIPDNTKQLLVDNGWKLIVSGTDLSSRLGFSYKIAGLTVTADKTIYFDNRVKDIDHAFVHEIGHAIDKINDWPSQSNEFAEIFEAEKYEFQKIDTEDIGDGHDICSTLEYFASVFHQIYINGMACQENAPRSYEFVKRYCN